MADHTLDPHATTVSDVLTAERTPVLTVAPGDRVTVRTLNASGDLHPARALTERRPLIADPRGHCLAGPIAVIGARPGQVLAVGIESLTTDSWGFTVAGGHSNSPGRVELDRTLGIEGAEHTYLYWDIDADTATTHIDTAHTDTAHTDTPHTDTTDGGATDSGVAVTDVGLAVDIHPFLGVIGLPPEASGEHSTIPPRTEGAGNIDCKELVAGSTLFIPVTVADAFLFVGDGHAAQGDGEVGGTAIETGMTSVLSLDLLDEAPTTGVHANTPAGLITFGFAVDLNTATADALAAMLTWMQHLTDLPRPAVLALASTVVDMRVSQVANQTWGVHALLPARYADQLTRVRR